MPNIAPDAVVGPGSRVVLHFRLSTDDGAVIDESRPEEPLRLTLGDGTLAPALQAVLLGLRAGERRRVALAPGTVFGAPSADHIHRLGRAEFPVEMALAPGTVVGFTTPAGDEIAGTVKRVEGDAVWVDFNHPLAGWGLVFEVEIVSSN